MRLQKCDILVIGSGAAGLRTAIEAHDNGADVIVVGKNERGDPHTVLAAGGINAALGTMDAADSLQRHAEDTWKEGRFIAPPQAVLSLCKNAPSAIQDLLDYGCRFHKEPNGRLTQRFFGAHTYRRTCFFGDQIGKEIIRVLAEEVGKRKFRFFGGIYVTSLLKSGKSINGAFGFDMKTGEEITFNAKAVVLATGGYSRLFSRSSSRIFENTGDGIALALRAGAQIQDMEMVQFHPTGMVWPPEAEGMLVTEAVRGEGGKLYNSKDEQFMAKYHHKAELGPRDVVARAIYWEVEHGRGTEHNGVWLDITEKPKNYILKRLPKMYEQFKKLAGIDISKERMEVAPTAHYSMGGIRINWKDCSTQVDRLYAVGECTGGLHGANRLGGNSLAETIVFGKICGKAAAKFAAKSKLKPLNSSVVQKASKLFSPARISDGKTKPEVLRGFIQDVMWHKAGIIRDQKQLDSALNDLERAKSMCKDLRIKSLDDSVVANDGINMIPVAEAVVRSALLRKESRGGHYRKDFPEESDKYLGNLICYSENGELKIKFATIRIPKTWRNMMRKKQAEHKMLE